MWNRIIVVGVGLIGGSVALALKQAGLVGEVVGVGRSSLDKALALGIVDRPLDSWANDLPHTDLVLLATPVAQMPPYFTALATHLGQTTLITDAGSTKSDVVAAARAGLGKAIDRFIPAHPIAGAENSGPDAATATLFHGKKTVLTPLPENKRDDIAAVARFWRACGASTYQLSTEQHDQIFAAVSHLPHLLSFALVHDLAIRDERDLYFEFAASGFRDFTRIAASHPEMWRDICLANRQALIGEIDRYQRIVQTIKEALVQNDGERLNQIFDLARSARRDWGIKQSC